MATAALVPNGLSASRAVLGIAFPFIPPDWRFAVILVAALTDLLDGWAARWLRVESNTGRLLDPVADKVFVLMLAGTLLAEGTLQPLWALGIAARDVVVLGGLVYVIVHRQWQTGRQLRPSPLGKLTTAAQFAVLLLLAGWQSVPVWFLAFTTVLSIAAAVDYAVRFRAITRESSHAARE